MTTFQFEHTLAQHLGAKGVTHLETVQELWSGYGEIARYAVMDGPVASVIVKRVQLPEQMTHPRGWNTTLSHERKIRSYDVEANWYASGAKTCHSGCRVAHIYWQSASKGIYALVMEDLDASGFSLRKTDPELEGVVACLRWLAAFHAHFLGQHERYITSLWPTGCYWHLDTRPDEYAAMEDSPLKAAASAIDQTLKSSPFQPWCMAMRS